MVDFSDLEDGDADTRVEVGQSDEGLITSSLQPSDAEPTLVQHGMADATNLMSMQMSDPPQSVAYGLRFMQRVYDTVAGCWCYFEAEELNPTPAPGDTSPPHSGSVQSHEVLYEKSPGFVEGSTAGTLETGAPQADDAGAETAAARSDHTHPIASQTNDGLMSSAQAMLLSLVVGGVVKKHSEVLSTSALTYNVTHALGTTDVVVATYRVSTKEQVFTDVICTSDDAVTIGFATAPAAGEFRVVVQG